VKQAPIKLTYGGGGTASAAATNKPTKRATTAQPRDPAPSGPLSTLLESLGPLAASMEEDPPATKLDFAARILRLEADERIRAVKREWAELDGEDASDASDASDNIIFISPWEPDLGTSYAPVLPTELVSIDFPY
jgi:hypothetical protein